MAYSTLSLERRGPAAWIWMNRPEVHNAFDETLIADLTAAFAAVDADPNGRAIVLAGEGKSFSAGGPRNRRGRRGADPVPGNPPRRPRFSATHPPRRLCATPTASRCVRCAPW